MKATHTAYDYGVLDFLGKDKTKLTLCNVRVPSTRIDNENPTCEHCQREKAEAEALIKELQFFPTHPAANVDFDTTGMIA